ncbi:hypothetical protein EV182_002433 [Spiromyces aspiralis]|uniref:Uncharacterized protein n=1 Tax=Spiromyces aspiralis TaxID=68401 RepID=A0ACC1HGT1_9FUNG|nr:hypothetical protein EV182_002433 [Spiromyces aspiralis]
MLSTARKPRNSDPKSHRHSRTSSLSSFFSFARSVPPSAKEDDAREGEQIAGYRGPKLQGVLPVDPPGESWDEDRLPPSTPPGKTSSNLGKPFRPRSLQLSTIVSAETFSSTLPLFAALIPQFARFKSSTADEQGLHHRDAKAGDAMPAVDKGSDGDSPPTVSADQRADNAVVQPASSSVLSSSNSGDKRGGKTPIILHHGSRKKVLKDEKVAASQGNSPPLRYTHTRSKSHSFSFAVSSTTTSFGAAGRRPTDIDYLSRMHPVQKVLQQNTWDCGLACVCMILRAFGYVTCTISELCRQCSSSSIWTIDLAYLLRRYIDADFTYYTTYWGTNPDYIKMDFYKGDYTDDTIRVSKLFARASQEDIRILCMSLSLLDLKRFLVSRRFVAIILVDAQHLRCEQCSSQSRTSATKGLLRLFSRQEYIGHFVLAYGYITAKDEFLIRDPAMADEYCVVKSSTLEHARTRPGTDNDCIIIKL